ncbi:hypothetical protein AAHE18_09G193900 [Arachis hypogaea]
MNKLLQSEMDNNDEDERNFIKIKIKDSHNCRIPNDTESPNAHLYDLYLQDVQDSNEENTEDPITYLQDPNMNFRAVNLAYDDTSSYSDSDGTLPKDYFKSSVY